MKKADLVELVTANSHCGKQASQLISAPDALRGVKYPRTSEQDAHHLFVRVHVQIIPESARALQHPQKVYRELSRLRGLCSSRLMLLSLIEASISVAQ
jgi:hypothetical protein